MDSRRVEAFGVLGIPVDSDRNAVVHAYRMLARATHPDVSDDPFAADQFATIAAAYHLVSQDPPTSSMRLRIREAAPGHDGPSQASLRRQTGVAWAGPVATGWARPSATFLGGRHARRAPIVAGPVWVEAPRGSVDPEVRGG